jgi:DNA-binding LacI/PurR family transcriptional regulator
MKPVAKSSAVMLAATAIREEIESGRWDGRLPGARILAKRLGLSPPTVAVALAQLAADGWLEKPGERHAYRVVRKRRTGGRKSSPPASKRLLLLTHELQELLTETSRRILEQIRESATKKGWLVESQVVDFLHVKRARNQWDRLIQVDPGTSVIALYGRTALAEWAIRRKARMMFLGGVTNGLPVPITAVKSSQMAETAMERLAALGHWRIVFPLCDRAESFKVPLRELTRRAVESTGNTYVQGYHNPETDYLKPDVTWRLVESAFKTLPPSALVFLDWKELVTAFCFLSSRKLRIPEDVSLVLLNDQMEAEWFHPPLTRFRFPEGKIVRAMISWLENDTGNHPLQTTLTADIIKGATIAPPRDERRAPATPINLWKP